MMLHYDPATGRVGRSFQPTTYVGPDANGEPLHLGELVVYADAVWTVGRVTIRRISSDEILPLTQVGTMSLRRA